MTCRHSAGDPNCSSHPDNVAARQYEYDRTERERKEVEARTPDANKFEIVDFVRIGKHIVMKVLYPNCSKCAYEGNKIMVFLNITETELIRWKKIDPHFRDPKSKFVGEAPSPAARFPASSEGWDDACAYVQRKS